MVEGPGATRNGTKARALVGWIEKEYGTLVEAFSVGKEVYLVFSPPSDPIKGPPVPGKALRLHFGMSGTMLIGKKRNEGVPKWKGAPTIVLEFSSVNCFNSKSIQYMECFQATFSKVTPYVARSKYEHFRALDVCSPHFDSACVYDALHKRPASILADAILDQLLFPGVGNIIKIEALHEARLNPKRLVMTCTKEELMCLIQHCRDYALLWLKRGRAPYKNVYNQTMCVTCKLHTVQIQKMGSDLSRTTFWCTNCQPISGDKQSATIAETQAPEPSTQGTPQNSPLPTQQSQCSQHGTSKLKLKRVRKPNANQGRLFLTCQVKCKLFAWADEHLHRCCKSPCTLKMSKTSKTGGQWFLCCKGCQYFAWAKEVDLQPFGPRLTPLL
ncbi:hypothetical protein SARC_00843 [Sphaeroforma arctica JP610]|uniref:Uncharacterized protein n=1 Tax=Sphaeroforma arctica JP610 TaxID=667725 RepID=A0A0L0GFH6_9EUKA|nr:hypothetical protein SARC_00843 [Sphaeroforma arctica JP610]KNC87033.1 hypothetical protein SARC_00843 [Sphaeroforma arctica JP610]|eukprot:XP_014160935.1 hypothetical protein SARC_00843 [Sphaeroforma arctica JP610]